MEEWYESRLNSLKRNYEQKVNFLTNESIQLNKEILEFNNYELEYK